MTTYEPLTTVAALRAALQAGRKVEGCDHWYFSALIADATDENLKFALKHFQYRAPITEPASSVEGKRGDPRYQRLYDAEWVNIVNHDKAYADWNIQDAVNHAVKYTETKMAEKFAEYLAATRPTITVDERGALTRVEIMQNEAVRPSTRDIDTVCKALRRLTGESHE